MRVVAVVLGMLVATACTADVRPAPSLTPQLAATAAPSAPPAAVSSTATAVPFTLKPSLFVNDDPSPVRDGYRANGDETLTFRLDFFADMEHGSVERAITAHLAPAANFRWPAGDASVLFDVPAANTSFVVDASGARSKSGGGTVGQAVWHVDRPTTSVSLYRPADLVTGSTVAARTYTFGFDADVGFGPRFDPAGNTALLYVGAPRREFVFVDVTTGSRRALPWDLNKIGQNGSQMLWLPDGRFLTLGTNDTIVAGAQGEDMRWLVTLPPGQFGTVSPSGKAVAVWSYTAATAGVQDLDSGALRSIAGRYLRCSAYAGASLTWSPDGRTVAVGSCTRDMAGDGQTVFVDATTGEVIRSIDRWVVVAWLPDGRLLARSYDAGVDSASRLADGTMTMLDGSGRVLFGFASPQPRGISPDGRWLLDGGLDVQRPHPRLLDLSDGSAFSVPDALLNATWTWTNELAAASH